jgi:hypothetical protein
MNDRELKIFNSLELIVELGSGGSSPVGMALPRVHSYGVFWGRWNELLSSWDSMNLEQLIKGLVKLEALSSPNTFGSVSPVPQIFSLYCTRVDEVLVDALANWVLANTVNDYCPYGTHNYGAKSLIELSMLEQQRNEIKRKRQDQEFARKKEAKLIRAKVATSRLPNAILRKDKQAINALLSKGADPDFIQQDGTTARGLAEQLKIPLNIQMATGCHCTNRVSSENPD